MQKIARITALFVLMFSQVQFAQTNPAFGTISEKLDAYFLLKREAISVHFNKLMYLTNEKIWFKGYVLDRKIQNLDQATTNVYMQILDDKNEVVAEELLFCYGGTFSGSFQPEITLETGVYHFRFFTHYMNNFEEDESISYDIQVINPFNNDFVEDKIQGHDLRLSYVSEGGTLLENVKSSLTVRLTDCLENPIRNQEVVLVDQNQEVVKQIKLNDFGLGKIEFIPETDSVYSLKTVYNGQEFQRVLNGIQAEGVVFSVNNIGLKNKCIFRLATNEKSLETLGNDPFYIVIHQDEKALILEASFANKKAEQLMVIENSGLFDGVNVVRLLDQNLKEIASRFVFNYPKEVLENVDLVVEKHEDGKKIAVKGLQDGIVSNLSISVLPIQSVAKFGQNSIKTDFLVHPYISEKFKKLHPFINRNDRFAAAQMDLVMASIKVQKYAWNDIMQKQVVQKYEPQIGITIRGKVLDNSIKKNRTKFKVQAYSMLYDIDEYADIDENDEFVLRNFILTDSTFISFNLVKDLKDPKKLNATFRIEDNQTPFNKPLDIYKSDCKTVADEAVAVAKFRMPNILNENVIALDNVDLVGSKSKRVLENAKKNPALRGYKVKDDDPLAQNNILYYLERNGFVVRQTAGSPISVSIRNSNTLSVNAGASRALLIINGMQYRDYDVLRDIFLRDVDEIYTSTIYLEPSINLYAGKIVIYLKNGFVGGLAPKKTNTDFLIKEGFSPRLNFVNSIYQSTDDDGFENFGVIHWEPFATQNDGFYGANFNPLTKEKFYIQIEGIAADGKLISIQKLVE
uniref:hypothetical protein n=1 Tax=Flavobacterium sp. TaxID=239 RepID=UPI00404A45B5